jgi:hypothetical protein
VSHMWEPRVGAVAGDACPNARRASYMAVATAAVQAKDDAVRATVTATTAKATDDAMHSVAAPPDEWWWLPVR